MSEYTPIEKRYTSFLNQSRNCAEAVEVLFEKTPDALSKADVKALKIGLSYMVITDFEKVLNGEIPELPRGIFIHFTSNDKGRAILNEAMDIGYSVFLKHAYDVMDKQPDKFNRVHFGERTQIAYDELANHYREHYAASLTFYPEGTFDSEALHRLTKPANANISGLSGQTGPQTPNAPHPHKSGQDKS